MFTALMSGGLMIYALKPSTQTGIGLLLSILLMFVFQMLFLREGDN